ncbi:methyltransferase [Streptomyces sp. NEAU-H3]|uniref:methyltransferase n=1 Tax=Streptomyces sp. NEAU-H3 TaxID=2720636 RepID=UPI0014387340|nr:methyltransferase [Streptomyces sp. NEAU-H3]NJA56098.1 methyltransferase [Streptomyces sp. NEAU-H3]
MTLYQRPLTPAGSPEAAPDETGRMFQMITGYWATQIARTAAELRLAEHLGQGPRTAAELARAAALDPAATRRFLRGCDALGLVTTDDGERYAATPLLDTLRADRPGSLRDLALWGGMTSHWQPWGLLPDAVRTGRAQSEAVFGEDLFTYFAAHEQEGTRFAAAMSAMTRGVADDLADVITLRGDETVLDVGGAAGAFVQTLMARHPALRGAVLELPHLAKAAEESTAAAGLSERFTFVAGDFLDVVPPADVYLLKYVLHDWDDETAVRILRNCRAGLRPGGRVLVTELVIDPEESRGLPPLMDLNMLTLSNGGRERERAEFAELFEAAGLRLVGVTPSASLVAVVEGVAA